ncbi:MAG: alpha/beta fold hydrolase [Thermoleophilia bacterium]
MTVVQLATGAQARLTGPEGGTTVVCLNGGTARPLPGTWGASVAWLVGHLAPRLPGHRFVEVRYRTRSWRNLEPCVADALAAVETFGGSGPVTLLGYSMGGAVAVAAALRQPRVDQIVGLAPWIPDRMDLSGLRGRRLDVFHGTLDGWLPGIPGVSPRNSQDGVRRAAAAGALARHTMLPGAMHAVAFTLPWGGLMPAPRARAWLRAVEGALSAPGRGRDGAGRAAPAWGS